MSFGRKTGAISGSSASVAPAAGATPVSAELAAFLASERARRQGGAGGDAPPATPLDHDDVAPPQRSMALAYLLWALFGGLGLHRHYVGMHLSGLAMMGLMIANIVLSMQAGPGMSLQNLGIGLAVTAAMAIWMLADAFLLPAMVRAANIRPRPNPFG